jgi:hypothetical protein
MLAFVGAIGFGGCDEEPDTGRVHLVLGDAPYPIELIESAEVAVEAIAVHVAGDGAGWEHLPFAPTTFDLLDLQNGVTAELTNAEVPVGELDEVRLLISSGEIVLTDGRVMELTVPSGAASGLKIKVRPPITILADLTTDILLDMDVARSFLPIPSSAQQAAEIDSFKFHPVVRAANLNTTGSVFGWVISDNGTPDTSDDWSYWGASILVHDGIDSSTTFSDNTGYFQVLGLDPGMWQVEVEASGYSSASVNAQVYAGYDTSVDTLLLSPISPRQ